MYSFDTATNTLLLPERPASYVGAENVGTIQTFATPKVYKHTHGANLIDVSTV